MNINLAKADSYSVGVIIRHVLAGVMEYEEVQSGEYRHIPSPECEEE
jgi:hypothetical protein